VTESQRALPVDLVELSIALEAEADASAELRWFFDLDSGAVILVSREYDPAEWGGLSAQDLENTPARFKPVPPADPQHALADMSAFVAALTDSRLKESIELALSAPRPERRFRAVLGWLPEELEKWRAFRQQRAEARALTWLASLGVRLEAPPAA